MEAIFKRRSVRKYTNQPIEKEKVEKLLRAAMQAPSAGNQQPWEFIVVENKETLAQLSEMSPYAKPLKESPLAIVVLGNKNGLKFPETWQQDLGAAAENMLLEAVNEGLGGLWLGVAPVEDRMNYIAELFKLENHLQVFAVLSFGYPAEEPNSQDRYDPTRVHYEKY